MKRWSMRTSEVPNQLSGLWLVAHPRLSHDMTHHNHLEWSRGGACASFSSPWIGILASNLPPVYTKQQLPLTLRFMGATTEEHMFLSPVTPNNLSHLDTLSVRDFNVEKKLGL